MDDKNIFKGAIFDLVQKKVKIKNKYYNRDIIRHPGGVGVVCEMDNKILLVKQFRHAIDSYTLEIPAGKLEYGENPKECGLRELNEEAGIECDDIQLIQYIVSTPGFCDEKIWIYKAIHPKPTQNRLSLDEDEEIETIWMDIDEAYKMTLKNEIFDAKTVIGILHAMLERKK
jgi:ADP-ribose pyrophosphatase